MKVKRRGSGDVPSQYYYRIGYAQGFWAALRKVGATAMPPSSGGSLIQFFLFPLDAVFNKVAPFAV